VEDVNLSIYQGDTGVYSFVLTSRGLPADLSEAVFLMQIRASWADDSDVQAELPYVVNDNRVTFTLTPALSKRLSPGTLRWDVQMSDAKGEIVATFARGRFTVVPEVSRG
jgi:hypothetical protein